MTRSLIHKLLTGDWMGEPARPSPAPAPLPSPLPMPSVEPLSKAQVTDGGFKGADWDPYEDTRFFVGDKPNLGHPGAGWLSFRTLRQAADRSICAPFKSKRQQQFAEYCRPSPNRWTPGYFLGMRDPQAKLTPGARKEFRKVESMLNRLQPFHRTVGGMMADDSLTYDWAIAEIQYERGGRPYAFRALDASWVRRGRPKRQSGYNYQSDTFVQVLPSLDRVVATWHADEIMCVVRRPRTQIEVFGYGYPEIQQAYDALMAYTEADDYNQVYFRNGAHASTLLNVYANYDKSTWMAFKTMMTTQIKGINNAHRLAMALFSPGSEGSRERVEKLDLAHTNNDMQFTDLMLIKLMIVAANFNMRPIEVGLPEYKGAGAPLSGANPKDEIQLSRMFGLRPMLVAFEDAINESLIYRWDEDFAFRFVMDAETELERTELELKGVQSGVFTANDARARLGQDIIDNAYFERRKLSLSPELRDKLVLAMSVPMSNTTLQALGAFGDQSDAPSLETPALPISGMEN